RMERAGLRVSPRDILVAQNVRRLAEVARERVAATIDNRADDMPQFCLTAIQRRFFDLALAEPHHFNQAVLLQLGPNWNWELLERAVARVVGHHEAFRLRFERGEDGEWQQRLSDELPSLEVISVTENSADRLAEIIARTHRSLNFIDGPVARFVYCDWG